MKKQFFFIGLATIFSGFFFVGCSPSNSSSVNHAIRQIYDADTDGYKHQQTQNKIIGTKCINGKSFGNGLKLSVAIDGKTKTYTNLNRQMIHVQDVSRTSEIGITVIATGQRIKYIKLVAAAGAPLQGGKSGYENKDSWFVNEQHLDTSASYCKAILKDKLAKPFSKAVNTKLTVTDGIHGQIDVMLNYKK